LAVFQLTAAEAPRTASPGRAAIISAGTPPKVYAARFGCAIRAAVPAARLAPSEQPQAIAIVHGRVRPRREIRMATYIVLSSFTDQGIRTVKETTKRADAVRETASRMGIETKSLYWTVGKYDVVATFEAPDDASITALSLAIGSSGNVRTQTMRAFTKEEVTGILAKL
jgi:uncharacterized protein with GYD domain